MTNVDKETLDYVKEEIQHEYGPLIDAGYYTEDQLQVLIQEKTEELSHPHPDQVTFYENSPTSSLDDYYDFCDVDDEIVLMMESGDTDNPRFKELVQIRDAYLD